MTPPQIIVINDDTHFLTLMEELLSEEGYRVTIWREGPTAYEAVKDQPTALVILDIRLGSPELGWTVLELLRLDPVTRPIPVIVCTADSVFVRAKAPQLLALDCLALEKPFDLPTLLDMVATCIGTPPAASR